MSLDRRRFLQSSSAALVAAGTLTMNASLSAADRPALIIDTHQHLWDLSWQKPPWLEGAPDVLRKTYATREYKAATDGYNVRAIYMEVDVAPEDHVAEARHVVKLSQSDSDPTIAATIGGRPASDQFADYLDKFKGDSEVKGLRQVLHNPESRRGLCLEKSFVKGVQELGERGLHFDICIRPTELADAKKLSELCPDTRMVLDHCGNADPKAFGKSPGNEEPWHQAGPWKSDIEALAKRPNVICKISGIVARAPKGWTSESLAPIVNHCLDSFGPDRVVFGGDWPVCLLGAPLAKWIDAVQMIVSERPAPQQAKLWHANAEKFYGLKS